MLKVSTHLADYEFDEPRSLVRRLWGVHPPAAYQAPDGQWQSYSWFTPPVVGDFMVIHYGPEPADAMWTSPVTEIIEEFDEGPGEAPVGPPRETLVVVIDGVERTYRLESINYSVEPPEYVYTPVKG